MIGANLTQLPSITELLLPVLKLAGEQEEVSTQLVTRLLAEKYDIVIGQDSRMQASKDLKSFHTRIGWAFNYLKGANLLNSHRFGYCQITSLGREILAYPPKTLSRQSLRRYKKLGEGKSPIEARKNGDKGIDKETGASVTLPGIFYEIKRTGEGEIQFNRCPQPLLPREEKPGAFFESIVLVKNAVSSQPGISAIALYQKVVSWAGQYHPNGMQVAFDALSMAGLLPQQDWTREPDKPVTLLLPDGASLAELRKYCVMVLFHSVEVMPELLFAISVLPQPNLKKINDLLNDWQKFVHDLDLRLKLLADFEVIKPESLNFKLSSLGNEILKELSTTKDFSAITRKGMSSIASKGYTSIEIHQNESLLIQEEAGSYSDQDALKIPAHSIEKKIYDRIFCVLKQAIQIMFPMSEKTDSLIKKHNWWTKQDLGESNGKPNEWRGWSIKLKIGDLKDCQIYIDTFDNQMADTENIYYFGEKFAKQLVCKGLYVVIFTTGFTTKFLPQIEVVGFTPRYLGKHSLHACVVIPAEEFMQNTLYHWAAIIIKLISFRSTLIQEAVV